MLLRRDVQGVAGAAGKDKPEPRFRDRSSRECDRLSHPCPSLLREFDTASFIRRVRAPRPILYRAAASACLRWQGAFERDAARAVVQRIVEPWASLGWHGQTCRLGEDLDFTPVAVVLSAGSAPQLETSRALYGGAETRRKKAASKRVPCSR